MSNSSQIFVCEYKDIAVFNALITIADKHKFETRSFIPQPMDIQLYPFFFIEIGNNRFAGAAAKDSYYATSTSIPHITIEEAIEWLTSPPDVELDDITINDETFTITSQTVVFPDETVYTHKEFEQLNEFRLKMLRDYESTQEENTDDVPF